MEDQQPAKEGLFEQLKEYVRLRIRLAALMTAEKIAEFYAGLVAGLILALCLMMVLLFGSFAMAFYFAELLNSTWCGFLCVAGFYLLITIIVLLIRKKSIEKPLMDKTVKKFFAVRDDEDEK